MTEIQMILRQWESNADENMDIEITKVLGLLWNKVEDTISVKIPKELLNYEGEEVTSRTVLSLSAMLFDPIGILCPIAIQPRMLLQHAWKEKWKWDQQWDESYSNFFLEWIKELTVLSSVKIPRFAYLRHDSLQIHVFGDASKSAYASVAFARVQTSQGVKVVFISGKSRIAPLSKKEKTEVSIPRLELLACTFSARLAMSIRTSLQVNEVQPQFYFWTDSSSCLAWIQRECAWGVFVKNRVDGILKLSTRDEWRHIPGSLNPADLPSRGCGPIAFVGSSWWEGPFWLYHSEKEWPKSKVTFNEAIVNCEKRKTIVSSLSYEIGQPRFSIYMRNVRVWAWLIRFVYNCRHESASRLKMDTLSENELNQGELALLIEIQNLHFSNEPPKICGFMVQKHTDGLWRLTFKDDTSDFKMPIVLPQNNPIVEQIVRFIHESSHHAGVQYVLNKLRERYWIVGGRATVKKILHNCIRCQRYRIKALQSAPVPLPRSRVQTRAAFQTTGVDLAGPIAVKGGKKAWIVLYTCAVYRGVHLDLVDSLSTERFLLSLERFIHRVGRPHVIYSDHGTNFVGANNLMQKVDWETLTQESGAKKIKWIYSCAGAPWQGGWWERMIRSTKDLLRKMLGRAELDFEELRTCLAGVEQVINDRPLTAVTADIEDLQPLTPSMFLRDIPLLFPEGEVIAGTALSESYNKMQSIRAALQARFRKEYLGFITSRNLGKGDATPKIGALVLVGDSDKKRYQWPLGRILELIPGTDGKVRNVKVRVATGILTRPIQRVYPLEACDSSAELKTRKSIMKSPHKSEAESSYEVNNSLIDPIKKTKCGREVRKPVRYGDWSYKN